MTRPTIKTGTLHRVPQDLRTILVSHVATRELWNGLNPLARNEWICYVTIPKKPETRADHLRRLAEDLRRGKRRPCCWPGCPHRRPNAAKWFHSPKVNN
ncbi:MAG: YdeI/OmpD-associated family protein [Candidatus Moraniibacteriota bacterium]